MNILFVCRYNRFRSKFGEGFFKKYYKGNKHQVKSAGLFKGYAIGKYLLDLSKNMGIKLTPNPQAVSSDILNWVDMIIIVAKEVPRVVFSEERRLKGKKIVEWRLPDSDSAHPKKTRKIALEIEKKVQELIKEIK